MALTEIHPLLIHFPIALLSVSLLCDGLGLLLKQVELERVGWWNLVLGLISALGSVVTGFLADTEIGHMAYPFPIFKVHGSTQLLATLLFSALFLWRRQSRGDLPRGSYQTQLYLVLGSLAVGLLFYGGHLGARLAGRV